jgi:hypothetical protein
VLTRFLLVIALFVLTANGNASTVAPKRKPQEYGAPKREADAEEVLLWGPRVVFFPLWAVSEYVVRRPIGAFVVVAEREQWPLQVVSFFTFGERRQVRLYPSAFFDFGLKPSVGFNLSWKHFLAEPNTLRAHFGTWGPDWIAAKVVDTYEIDAQRSLSLEGGFTSRKDLPFFGMGPLSESDLSLRYQAMTAEVAASSEITFWRSSRFVSRVGFRSLGFGDGSCCGEPSVRSAVDAGAIPEPPGLDAGYAAAFQSLSLTLDTRRPRPEPGSGVRLEARGEGVFAPGSSRSERRSWISYGASAGAALDLGRARAVALNVTADLIDPLIGTVPFTDQISLGGERPMRGFIRNRLIDRSALVGTLQYTWPVWVFLDGVVQADVGNVFGERFDGIDAGLMRLSTGLGVRSNGDRDSRFEVLVAAGTDPFESGLRFSSFRFVIGSHHGF